jgi:LCP family protein required for cell wall assembly
MRRKQLSFDNTVSKSPKKAVGTNSPADFPVIGATLSAHSNNYFDNVNPTTTKKHRRFSIKKIIKRTLVVLIIIILIVGGWVGWKFYENTTKTFGGSIFGIFDTTKLKGESTGRVNILLAGDSADDPGHQGADLTDSIMLVSLDTKNNTAFMISIPRDLWVDIPGYGYQKINAAYEDGQADKFDQAGYASGGMGLLEEVVQQNFNVPIDYYALINYTAFKDSVNAVGGISIDIQSSDPRGLYDPNTDLKLPNGEVTLNGQVALNLARARGDGYGSYGFPLADFNRTQNQRLMLLAVEQKALSAGVLSNPLKLGNLFDSLGNNVQTDFQINDIRRLYDLGKKVTTNNIQSDSLNQANGQDLLMSYTAYDGESALIPAAGINDYSAIQAYMSQLTNTTTN